MISTLIIPTSLSALSVPLEFRDPRIKGLSTGVQPFSERLLILLLYSISFFPMGRTNLLPMPMATSTSKISANSRGIFFY